MKDGSLHLFLPSFMGRLFCWFIAGAQLTRSTSCLPFNFFSLWVPVDISLGEDNGTPLQYSCLENPMDGGAWKATVMGSLRVRHDWATSLSLFTFHFHALEKEMATHSSILAWRIPGTGEPGGLPSMGLHRVRHDWSDLVVVVVDISLTSLKKMYFFLCNSIY